MPNDMSATSERLSPTDALLCRAARYIARAEALSEDPLLNQGQTVEALSHLDRMQRDLARARLAQTRPLKRALEAAERAFSKTETNLKIVRGALSEALLHAIPQSSAGDAPLGIVPHGPAASGAVSTYPASISRAVVDLEALRPFLSDHALEQAVARRSKESGQCDVAGVTYANLPRSARLKCDVL